jgi:hypothetical protein
MKLDVEVWTGWSWLRWWALVTSVMNLRVSMKCGEFLE